MAVIKMNPIIRIKNMDDITAANRESANIKYLPKLRFMSHFSPF